MRSTIMDIPLTITSIMRYGVSAFGDREVVTCTEGGVRRRTYAEAGRRAARLANALRRLGVDADQRVAEAAVIGVEDEKWGERPLAAVVLRPGADVTAEKLRTFMAEQVPRWQLPERWCFIAEVPKTSVGKFSKRVMREAYASGDYEIIEVH